MNVISAIILGLVQGLTEFIPVSSSGHMILAEKVFGIQGGFKFDVLLNIGTLLALAVFYRKTIVDLARRIFVARDGALFLRFVVATVPAVFIGFVLGSVIEESLQSYWVVIVMLLLVGSVMVMAKFKPTKKKMDSLSLAGCLRIGLAQALALIPGTSRSGMTILAGQNEGLTSEEAARFSFMLAIPTIAGATLKVALSGEGRSYIAEHLDLIIIGNVVSFLAGSLAIKFLISMLSKNGLKPFGWYRIGLSALLILLIFAKII